MREEKVIEVKRHLEIEREREEKDREVKRHLETEREREQERDIYRAIWRERDKQKGRERHLFNHI